MDKETFKRNCNLKMALAVEKIILGWNESISKLPRTIFSNFSHDALLEASKMRNITFFTSPDKAG